MADKTELLIETVKKYPAIYDKNNPGFKVKYMKEQSWVEVAEIMGEERDVLKAKWRNLRDSHSKHLRAWQPSVPGASRYIQRYRMWPWAKQFEFMKPFTEATLENSWKRVSWRRKVVRKRKASEVKEEEQPQKSASASPQNQHLTEFINTRPDPIEPNSTQPSTESRLSDFDETDLIFLGYARILKRMSALRQASTRYQVAQVLMQAEVDQANEDSGAAPHIKNSPRNYATESEG